MSPWLRPLLLLLGTLLAAGTLAGVAALFEGDWRARLHRLPLVMASGAMAVALVAIAVAGRAAPYDLLLLAAVLLQFGWALAETLLRRRRRP